MNRGGALKKLALCCFAMSLIKIEGQTSSRGLMPPSESQASAPCSGPQYRQFDFWIGDWDAFDVGKPSTVVAHNRVESILGGCVLHEYYRGVDGSEGQSFSIYDVSRNTWHQTWVTNRGKLLVIEGEFRSATMVLGGVDRTVDGRERRVRGIWTPAKGGIRETAVTSIDEGRTWQSWFCQRRLKNPHFAGLKLPSPD